MSFCRNCGTELRDGDKFCHHCGSPVSGERAAENKNRTLIFAGMAFAGLLVIMLIVLLVWKTVGLNRENSPGLGNITPYVTYSNENVLFSVDYPDDYTVTEPNNNNVLITDGEEEDGAVDFQVSVEYAYHTASDSAIYSAGDFAEQIETRPEVLTEWLGSDDVEVTGSRQTKIGGYPCYEYDVELWLREKRHTGELCILDSEGEFGCYSYLWLINEECGKAELYRTQCDYMKDSFCITGACQAEGYKIYSYDEPDIQFMIREDALGKAEETSGSVVIYPVDHVYSEANIWILATSYYEEEKDVEEVLESKCDYYFSEKEQAEYLSGPTALEYGRYPYTGIDLQFYEKGEKYTVSVFAFVQDGIYWTITMKSTDTYYDTVATAASDVLFSLKFGKEAEKKAESGHREVSENNKAADAETLMQEVITGIEKQSGYLEGSLGSPLGVMDDFNGDGVQEFLAVYEREENNRFEAVYELWSLPEAGAEKMKSETLFQEVGGNGGTVGIVENDGTVYLAVQRSEPDGAMSHNYESYYPWNPEKSIIEESNVYLESHSSNEYHENSGSSGAERYILGDTGVEKEEFEKRKADFSNWIYKLQLIKGAGDGVMTFEELKRL